MVFFQGLWLAIAVAVLRYCLYDVDIVINRTLVYGTLTLMLAALYLGGVAATQDFLDRRFYRSKFDARKTLEAFSATLREETDLDRLGEALWWGDDEARPYEPVVASRREMGRDE